MFLFFLKFIHLYKSLLFQNQFAKIGERAHLKCKIFSLSKSVTINWEKNGHSIERDQFSIEMNDKDSITSELIIDIDDENDFGDFSCSSENEIGMSYKIISLQKKGILSHIKFFVLIRLFLFRRRLSIYHTIHSHCSPLPCHNHSTSLHSFYLL